MASRNKSSEFRSYSWIKEKLRDVGWNTANPNVDARGQVWEQNEVLTDPNLKKGLGSQRPEFAVRITDKTYWMIEAKNAGGLPQAIEEAIQYADDINAATSHIQVRFATGVAGTEHRGFVTHTKFLTSRNTWEDLREGPELVEGFVSTQEALRVLAADNPDLNAVPLTVLEIVEIAKYINSKFHSAKVTKEKRALLVAVLLLALQSDPSLSHRGSDSVFLSDIKARAKEAFTAAKREALWDSLGILPEGPNTSRLSRALSDILLKLKKHDLLSTAQSTDVLGAFFESFLRYGNTSKDLGIVLTPRHLCWFAAEATGITKDDIVYDPAVGTGGFLVGAFNRVLEHATPAESERFATRNLYGMEQADNVAALAFINMYFRGDGKHNLKIDDALPYRLVRETPNDPLEFRHGPEIKKGEETGVTRVLMNPPFALPDEDEAEIYFVETGLRQLVQNGILFSVLPASVLYSAKSAAWRQELLKKNTVLSVVALPIDLFYPVATETVGLFIRKGRKHRTEDSVLWARMTDDGFVKRKGYRVERKNVNYQIFLHDTAQAVRRWVTSGIETPEIPGELEFRKLESSEWLPQAHLGTGVLEEEVFQTQIREAYRQMLTQQLRAPSEDASDPYEGSAI